MEIMLLMLQGLEAKQLANTEDQGPSRKEHFGPQWLHLSKDCSSSLLCFPSDNSLVSGAHTGRSSSEPLQSFSSSNMDCEHLSRSEHGYCGQILSNTFLMLFYCFVLFF